MAQTKVAKAVKRWIGIGPGRPSSIELLQAAETDEDGVTVRKKYPSPKAFVVHLPSALKKLMEG